MSTKVPASKATMQLGRIDASSTTMIAEEERTILHECGHMLGLKHEHQSPASRLVFTFDENGNHSNRRT